MQRSHALFLLLALWLTYACCEPYAEHSPASATNDHPNTLLSAGVEDAVEGDVEGNGDGDVDASNYDKRVERYAYGLGRRAYTYTSGGGGGGSGSGSGVKRLPIYNFGLGKRARPYSFGLGKRAEFDDADVQYDEGAFDRSAYKQAFLDEKRNRPYSFGLGKRESLKGSDRRSYANRYGFGLGRR